MSSFLYIIVGFAIGFEAGKLASGQKCDWKKSLIAGGIALAIAIIIVILIKQF